MLQSKYDLLKHDSNSSYYFATTLKDNADKIIKETGWIRNYPMLHKMSFYDSRQKLPTLEKLHNKILNIPLWKHIGEQ